jgi:hypothetical protein
MSRAPTDPEKLAAAIQQLEAERRRREDERIAAGTAIREPLLVVVPPGAEETDKLIEETKAARLAALRAQGDDREILFEEPELLVTGVPRSDDFGKWKYEHLRPLYPDRYADGTLLRKGDDGGVPKPPQPAPSEWKSIRVQVAAPNENSGDPGRVIEAEYVAVGNQVRVRYDGKGYVETFTLGDDPVAIARRLLRAKWDKHGAFFDDIRYPRRSFH